MGVAVAEAGAYHQGRMLKAIAPRGSVARLIGPSCRRSTGKAAVGIALAVSSIART